MVYWILGKFYRYFYIVIFLIFLVWMIFLDTHSLKIHRELNQEIEKLETQKKELKNLIEKDLRNIDQLVSKDSLERFARENYGHKKENETIFYIEIEDSLNLQ
ncbi:MAG: septum formation initiator family protein [Flavobacteriaceae bacterium]|nr:septum formation initiator family protein [Flavobacteriaceae bacterium]MDG1940799.1 septum formation initiator family protein [Flavobacteriaceae bacterium]